MADLWWNKSGGRCYLGFASDGLEWSRHGEDCIGGYWRVAITGWRGEHFAVMDDFGNLVEVYP
jgi:hypothetical protein